MCLRTRAEGESSIPVLPLTLCDLAKWLKFSEPQDARMARRNKGASGPMSSQQMVVFASKETLKISKEVMDKGDELKVMSRKHSQ